MAEAPTTYNEVTGTNVGNYEEAVADRLTRFMTYDGPVPDRPTGEVVYTNPALTPAPISTSPLARTPVPVINDPGLIGHRRPSLADINKTARQDWAANGEYRYWAKTYEAHRNPPPVDDTEGITEQSHQEAITRAAQARMDELNAKVGK